MNRLRWAGHVARTGGERLAETADGQRVEWEGAGRRTARRQTWEEWWRNGEREQKIDWNGDILAKNVVQDK